MNTSASSTDFVSIGESRYDHTQHGPLFWLLLLPAIVSLASVLFVDGAVALVLLFAAAVLIACAMSFRWLRVRDDGACLALRFGPLPIFQGRIAYRDITEAERDRTMVIDGWGIHWVPGRGWTYNLWGFDCVRVTLKNGHTTRIGTDDPEGLATFLQQKGRESTPTNVEA